MDSAQVEEVLSAVRRLRRGTLDPTDAPSALYPALGRGLGYSCDKLAIWVEQRADDRRGADAAIRFFGLGRLPEPLQVVAETLRDRHGRRGLSVRQVQNLIADVLRRLATDPAGPGLRPASDAPGQLADPFPLPPTAAQRRELNRVLLWAWADIPDMAEDPPRALLLYEHEHGLRRTAPAAPSRTARQRWRRLTWSMLHVARYRLSEARADDPVLDRLVGGRSLAVVDRLDAEGLNALMQLRLHPTSGDVDEALRVTREAVKLGLLEAPELLGILRDAVVRLKSVRPAVTSKMLALAAILAKERRDPAGIPVALVALDHAAAVLEHGGKRPAVPSDPLVASDGLRTGQELIELYISLRMYPQAWMALRRMRNALENFGDPEHEEEPEGWRQQLLLTTASVSRHLARASARPERWRQVAIEAAERSASLALDTGALPPSWGLAARNQRAGTTLDATEAAAHSDGDKVRHLLHSAHRQLDIIEADWRYAPASRNRDDHAAKLATTLIAWRLALIEKDTTGAEAARERTWSLYGEWIRAEDLEKIESLDKRTMALGGLPGAFGSELFSQRGHLGARIRLRSEESATCEVEDHCG